MWVLIIIVGKHLFIDELKWFFGMGHLNNLWMFLIKLVDNLVGNLIDNLTDNLTDNLVDKFADNFVDNYVENVDVAGLCNNQLFAQ